MQWTFLQRNMSHVEWICGLYSTIIPIIVQIIYQLFSRSTKKWLCVVWYTFGKLLLSITNRIEDNEFLHFLCFIFCLYWGG
jgi:chromate transport protein ChrA